MLAFIGQVDAGQVTIYARMPTGTRIERTEEEIIEIEKEITALACLSYTNKEIADQLIISPATVKTHLRNAKRKFGLRSKLELRKILSDWDFSQWTA